MNEDTRKYVAEFLGTFTLVFVGTSVAALQGMLGMGPAGWLGISFAFGFTLMVLVLVIGPVSGCHVNPAVTIPMALSGRLKSSLAPGYVVAQLVGAAAASAALYWLLRGFHEGSDVHYSLGEHGLGANGNAANIARRSLLGWETIMTAMFLFTIFAATRNDAPPVAAPLAIGGFLFVAHLVGAPLGDASLNPARSFGPAIFVKGEALRNLWIFVVGPILGGLIGWQIYKQVYND